MKKLKLENHAIGPFPGMIVGAMVDGKPNYTAVGAGGCACLEPVLCVSLKNTHYITKGIIADGYFSINTPSVDLVKKFDYCGIVSGHTVDKSKLFTPFFDGAGSAPMIEETPLSFLCKVCDSKEIKGFTMFFGEIVGVFADEKCVTNGKIDPIKTDPIVIMGSGYYNLGEIVGQPFCEGKKMLRKL